MKNPLSAFRKLRPGSRQERRQHPRHASVVRVDYLVQHSWFRGSIHNISEGGLYIRSIEKEDFFIGDSIVMVVEFGALRHEIRGKISRVGSDGIAVQFNTSEPRYSEVKALLAEHGLL